MAGEVIKGATREGLDNYDPARYDARLEADGTYTLTPVLWWDEASYAAYQGDPYQGD